MRATARCASGCVQFFGLFPLSGSVSFNDPALGLIDSVCRHVRGYMVSFLGRFTQYGLGGTTSCGTALGPGGYEVALVSRGIDDSSGGAGTTFGGTPDKAKTQREPCTAGDLTMGASTNIAGRHETRNLATLSPANQTGAAARGPSSERTARNYKPREEHAEENRPQNTLKHAASNLLDHHTPKTPCTTHKKLEKPPTTT